MTSAIDLMLDNDNELRFKVNIEGTRPGSSVCQLMLEHEDLQYGFKGVETPDGEISVFIPPLKTMLKEGIYDTHLEVVVDDRIFIPLEMKINFEKSVSVTAESVVRPKRRSVSASAVLVDSPNVKSTGKTLREIRDAKKEPASEPKSINQTNSVDGKQILELLKSIKQSRGK